MSVIRHTEWFVMKKVGVGLRNWERSQHPTHRKGRDEWGTWLGAWPANGSCELGAREQFLVKHSLGDLSCVHFGGDGWAASRRS